MTYDPTTYRASAPHYRAGRPPYSAQLESTLQPALGLDGSGRLLDVGCGPGILSLRLAHLFDHVVGLDPDADMLAEAAQQAERDGIDNAEWVRATAEDLPAAAPGPFRLVTFGQSFHRTDEHVVAETVFDLLEPGGAMVMVVHDIERRPPPPSPGPPGIPHDAILAVVNAYLGSTRRSGRGIAPTRNHRFEDVLVETRFGAPTTLIAPGREDVVRDVDEVISGYLSMSYAAPHLFAGRLDDFVSDVRSLLVDHSPTGAYWDWPGDTALIVATRPARTA